LVLSDYFLLSALVTFVAWRVGSSVRTRRQIPEFLKAGARIVDVRSAEEFAGGHAPQSENVPLAELQYRVGELNPNQHIIVCCASGTRSSMARRLLRRRGFERVLNAGSWRNLP
jgi:phage shock protein E